ncbi:hypothetical protein FG91_04095 [Sphingopyxis sp. LC81]|uniref:hypothetical protein n=1 Tax=Sphingopyxis sp. LC81 TaxID=1502850 RepID=UPI00050DACAD|nr:hypothetical protein [Sphingopyxis sp. LC81]KGB51731.1 hypothetical protein FG91_04095 [Sphingopyxis sp. LC81]
MNTSSAPFVITPWKTSSSSSEIDPGRSDIWSDKAYRTTSSNVSTFSGSFATHRRMIEESATSFENVSPLVYMRFPKVPEASGTNSSHSLFASVAEHYKKIEDQLSLLGSSDDEDSAIEEGAINSALAVVGQLRCRNLAPPSLSWHGGDAIVMLWALGDTTYAITVTDGEVGYVVRRNKKAIRMADSIKLGSFKLADFR